MAQLAMLRGIAFITIINFKAAFVLSMFMIVIKNKNIVVFFTFRAFICR